MQFTVGGRRWTLTARQFAALEPLLDGARVALGEVRRLVAGTLDKTKRTLSFWTSGWPACSR